MLVQKIRLTFLLGDRIAENVALTRGLPVAITVTNTAHEFHAFAVLTLGLEGAT